MRYAVCGNHDLDSRYAGNSTDDPDPKGVLLDLSAPFPNLKPDEVNHFWARDYVIVERSIPFNHRIVFLNTSAYHGGNPEEIKHGRVSTRTIERIKVDLSKREPVLLNLLLCHHHLQPLPSFDRSPDYQYVKKGGELLRALEEVCQGPWLVVHGHRHWPECFYASGGASSPVVFCSSSFGARDPQIANQFHILTIEVDESFTRPKGLVETFTWTLGSGWTEGPTATGNNEKSLAYLSGFGFNGNVRHLAAKIAAFIGERAQLDWELITAEEEDVKHLLPAEFVQLKTELKRLSIGIYEEHGRPQQAGKKS